LNISVYIKSLNIVDTLDNIQHPINRIRSIPSLPTYNRFKCATSQGNSYHYLTIHKPNIKQHLQISHRKKSGGKGRPQRDKLKRLEYYQVQV
jgi:hypothetical protein